MADGREIKFKRSVLKLCIGGAGIAPLWRCLVSVRPDAPTPSAVAIATVDWTVATGLEWNRGILAALGTDRGVHLTRASIVSTVKTTIGTLVSPCLPT